ncbi:hypothetical protein FKP32DRAFT_1682289 [Trametes sanguinea]|nr:hypothetical protein FKP32DRAFT_1682289 [Trametes sanguinea]
MASALSRYRIPQLLSSVKPRHLSTIVLEFCSTDDRYAISRRELLAHVSGQAMQDALKPFPALRDLRLVVSEDDPAYDRAWWEQRFAEALPTSLRQVSTGVRVRMRVRDGAVRMTLWLEDAIGEE